MFDSEHCKEMSAFDLLYSSEASRSKCLILKGTASLFLLAAFRLERLRCLAGAAAESSLRSLRGLQVSSRTSLSCANVKLFGSRAFSDYSSDDLPSWFIPKLNGFRIGVLCSMVFLPKPKGLAVSGDRTNGDVGISLMSDFDDASILRGLRTCFS